MVVFELISQRKKEVLKYLKQNNINFKEHNRKLSFLTNVKGHDYEVRVCFGRNIVQEVSLVSVNNQSEPFEVINQFKEYCQNGWTPFSDNTNHEYNAYIVTFFRNSIKARIFSNKKSDNTWTHHIYFYDTNIIYKVFLKDRVKKPKEFSKYKYDKLRQKLDLNISNLYPGNVYFVKPYFSRRYVGMISLQNEELIIYYLKNKVINKVKLSVAEMDNSLLLGCILISETHRSISFNFQNSEDWQIIKNELNKMLGYSSEEYFQIKKRVNEILIDYDPNSLHQLQKSNFEGSTERIAKWIYKNPDFDKTQFHNLLIQDSGGNIEVLKDIEKLMIEEFKK